MSYSVSQSQTAQLADFESWDVVWFFHNSVQLDETANDPLRRMSYSFDWEAIADKAVLAGNVDAVCTHAIDQQGFTFFETENRIAPFSIGATNFPQYDQRWGVNHSTLSALNILPNHLYRFVKAFKSRGIKVGFYINQGTATNLFDYPSATAAQINCWHEYLIKEIKWLKSLYDIDFLWFDLPHLVSFTDAQRDAIYQASRAPNDSLVIYNSPSGAVSFRFPCDCKFIEFNFLAASETFYDPETTHDEVEYYIPAVFGYTGLYRLESDGSSQTVMWNPANAETYDGDDKTYNQVKDQTTFNTWYSYARDRAIPFFVNMPIVQNDLIATYYDRVKNTNLIAS